MGDFFDTVLLPSMKRLVEDGRSDEDVKRLVKILTTWRRQLPVGCTAASDEKCDRFLCAPPDTATSKGLTMAKPRGPWNIRSAKERPTVTASTKSEVETKAKDLINNVLKPKHVLPPPLESRFNYITHIGAKWHRNYFYFFSTYACPSPNALSPTFESKFARMEPVGAGKFALYFMRHTDEWVDLYDAISVDECLKAIQDDPCFVP
jgi:hypothetical protein